MATATCEERQSAANSERWQVPISCKIKRVLQENREIYTWQHPRGSRQRPAKTTLVTAAAAGASSPFMPLFRSNDCSSIQSEGNDLGLKIQICQVMSKVAPSVKKHRKLKHKHTREPVQNAEEPQTEVRARPLVRNAATMTSKSQQFPAEYPQKAEPGVAVQDTGWGHYDSFAPGSRTFLYYPDNGTVRHYQLPGEGGEWNTGGGPAGGPGVGLGGRSSRAATPRPAGPQECRAQAYARNFEHFQEQQWEHHRSRSRTQEAALSRQCTPRPPPYPGPPAANSVFSRNESDYEYWERSGWRTGDGVEEEMYNRRSAPKPRTPQQPPPQPQPPPWQQHPALSLQSAFEAMLQGHNLRHGQTPVCRLDAPCGYPGLCFSRTPVDAHGRTCSCPPAEPALRTQRPRQDPAQSSSRGTIANVKRQGYAPQPGSVPNLLGVQTSPLHGSPRYSRHPGQPGQTGQTDQPGHPDRQSSSRGNHATEKRTPEYSGHLPQKESPPEDEEAAVTITEPRQAEQIGNEAVDVGPGSGSLSMTEFMSSLGSRSDSRSGLGSCSGLGSFSGLGSGSGSGFGSGLESSRNSKDMLRDSHPAAPEAVYCDLTSQRTIEDVKAALSHPADLDHPGVIRALIPGAYLEDKWVSRSSGISLESLEAYQTLDMLEDHRGIYVQTEESAIPWASTSRFQLRPLQLDRGAREAEMSDSLGGLMRKCKSSAEPCRTASAPESQPPSAPALLEGGETLLYDGMPPKARSPPLGFPQVGGDAETRPKQAVDDEKRPPDPVSLGFGEGQGETVVESPPRCLVASKPDGPMPKAAPRETETADRGAVMVKYSEASSEATPAAKLLVFLASLFLPPLLVLGAFLFQMMCDHSSGQTDRPSSDGLDDV